MRKNETTKDQRVIMHHIKLNNYKTLMINNELPKAIIPKELS